MFNWFFNLFKSEDNKPLTRKADSEPNIQSKDYLSKRDELSNYLSLLKDRLEMSIQSEDNIVPSDEVKDNPELRDLFRYNISCMELALALRSKISSSDVAGSVPEEGIINMEGLKSIGPLSLIYNLAEKDSAMSNALDDALDISVYDYVMRIDWTKIPNTVKQLTKAFEGIPAATVEVMKQDPAFGKRYQGKSVEEILQQVDRDFANNEIRKVVRREKAGRIPARERENLANTPEVNKQLLQMQQEGQEYNAAHLPSVSPTMKDYETASASVLQGIDAVDKIATALRSNFVQMAKHQSVLLKPGQMAASLVGLQFDHSDEGDEDKGKAMGEDEKYVTKTMLGKQFNHTDPVEEQKEKEQNERDRYNFEHVINRLRKSEKQDPQTQAAVALIANALAEKSGIFDAKEEKNADKRPLNQQKTALEYLSSAHNLHIFDGRDVNKVFSDVYNAYEVPDPNNEGVNISLLDYKTTVEALKLVLQALNILKTDSTDKRKRRRASNTIMSTLEDFFTTNNPKADTFKKQIAEKQEQIADLHAKEKEGNTEDYSKQISALEKEVESLTEELAKYNTATRADFIQNLIDVCKEGKSAHGSNTVQAADVRKQTLELIKEYESKLKEYSMNANEKAKQLVVAAARKNETDVYKAIINDPRLSDNVTFKFGVKHHFADTLRRIISESNTQYLLDFMDSALTKPQNKYYQERPESTSYNIDQLTTMYEGKYADELVKFALWNTDKFDKSLQAGETDELKQHLKTVVSSAAGKGVQESEIDEIVNSILFSPAAFVSNVYDRNSLERKVAIEFIRMSSDSTLADYQKETGCEVAPFKFEFNPREAADILMNNTVVRELSDDFYAKIVAVKDRTVALSDLLPEYERVASTFLQSGYPAKENPFYKESIEIIRNSRYALERLRDARYELTNYMEETNPDKVAEQVPLREAKEALQACDELIDRAFVAEKQLNDAKGTSEKDAVEQLSNRVAPFTYYPEGLQTPKTEDDEEYDDGSAYTTIFPDQKVYVRDGELYKVTKFGDKEIPTLTPINKREEEIVIKPLLWVKYDEELAAGEDTESYVSNLLHNGDSDYFYVSDITKTKWFSVDLANPTELGDELPAVPRDAKILGLYGNAYRALNAISQAKRNKDEEAERAEQAKEPTQPKPSHTKVDDEDIGAFIKQYEKDNPFSSETVKETRQEQEDKPNITYYKEEQETDDNNGEEHSAGFSFFGIQKKAATFRFMGFQKKAGDGLDAFTSDQDLQKAIENPFGDAMSAAEDQIHKQRAVSPDNTSNQGQTSIQQDQQADKSFSSKQLIKAFKAAYEKDPGTFDDLLRLVSQSGSTGTFTAEILSKLPEVNWVAEAALRKYNETAQQPVHRNSFQQALEKANEEQLSKNEMFVNICRNILNGKPA